MTQDAWLNVAAWLPCTEAEGPGRRAALWVQGCDKRCPGCCNPGMLQFAKRELLPATEIVRRLSIARATFDIEGVTFLGGEPMLQARGLAQVALAARAMGLSVMVFTGYTLDELETAQPTGWQHLLQATDVLVDGPYLAQNPEMERRWIGSANQKVHYLSNRYEASIEQLPKEGRDVEVRIGTDGTVRINGWPVRMIKPAGTSASGGSKNPSGSYVSDH